MMHKARALANAYFFNSAYIFYNIPRQFKLNLPIEEAIKIIDEKEYEKLKFLEQMAADERRLLFDNSIEYMSNLMMRE